MTRKSKREVERALDGLDEESAADSIAIVHRHPRTGELVDGDGEPVDPEADTVIVFNDTVIVGRERAEQEGYEILGPAEDAPRDAVRVAWPEGGGR